MMTLATACGNVLIYGALGWVVVRLLGFAGQARAAGFCLAIGFAVGSFGGHAGTEAERLLLLRGIGSVLALGILSALMFFRRVEHSFERQT